MTLEDEIDNLFGEFGYLPNACIDCGAGHRTDLRAVYRDLYAVSVEMLHDNKWRVTGWATMLDGMQFFFAYADKKECVKDLKFWADSGRVPDELFIRNTFSS